MPRRACWATLLVLLTAATPSMAQDKKFTVKAANAEPPKELNDPIRKLFGNNTVQFFDPAGTLICELWFGKEVPVDATPEQFKNGLTYRELKESQIIAAVRFDQDWLDYRKQKVKKGVYTMRVGFQPQDGDHAGKSQYTDFVVLCAAARDKGPEAMSHKSMVELSAKSINSGHPGVFMLFPNEKPGKTALESRPRDHWVLNVACPAVSGGTKGTIGFGLTLVGEADE
ncbi:MAG TPA: hypothetical protein VE988_00385 [Gemmataceae bacterium]|nr:hypothetical protein [Gemmataceae bacterium]